MFKIATTFLLLAAGICAYPDRQHFLDVTFELRKEVFYS